MVDGTGMCGACRVSVGGRTRFACVDGPEFDGHQVDWDLLLSRQRIYLDHGEAGRWKLYEQPSHAAARARRSIDNGNQRTATASRGTRCPRRTRGARAQF